MTFGGSGGILFVATTAKTHYRRTQQRCMTTRSGREFRGMESSFETEATGGRDGVGELGSRDGEEAAVGRGLGHGGEEVPEVAASHGHGAETAGAGGMTALIQLLLAQQGEERRRREEDEQRRLQEERRRRDDEDRRRREEYQLQLETLRGVLERTAEGSPARPVDPGEHVKLTRFTENEDIEAYLTTFERVMTLGRVPNEAWTMRLAPQLSGKALQAYAATPTADAADYIPESQGSDSTAI